MQIRKMTFNDIEQVVELEKNCFDESWSKKMIMDSLTNSEYFFVAESDKKILGYCGMYPNGDIANIAVLEDSRGQGIGFALLSKLIDVSKKNGIVSIFLELRKSNINAVKLYEKCMFQHISVRKNYYKDGEDALIYMLEVN